MTRNLALNWSTHISIDRVIDYDLKYPSSTRRTHLRWPSKFV
ncbi:MAG: hypothetical protein DCC58_07380 [Chloroflexi bacterium]|nr:MAG: hypothetical protein DCC58_07380 [Chloroflexota bacterium]